MGEEGQADLHTAVRPRGGEGVEAAARIQTTHTLFKDEKETVDENRGAKQVEKQEVWFVRRTAVVQMRMETSIRRT